MSGGQDAVLRHVGRLFTEGSVTGMGDGALLERFLARHDEAAFEALVLRHGPLVLGVCRRVLDDPHDVEDAFQATFMVLVRRARSIRDRDRLGPWLFGVARRVAVRARTQAARRRSRERPGAEEAAVEGSGQAEPQHELRSVLDEEMDRLPEKYRAPMVLCYLQGLTHEEAAQRLQWPVGTVRSRMAWARERLRARLTRRGLAVPAGLLSTAMVSEAASAAVPTALLDATVKAATAIAAGPAAAGVVSASVAALTRGVVNAMFLNRLSVLAAVGLTAGLAAGGVGVFARQDGGDVATAARPVAKPASDRLDDLQKEIDQRRLQMDKTRAMLKSLTAQLDESKYKLQSLLRELEIAKAERSPDPAPASEPAAIPPQPAAPAATAPRPFEAANPLVQPAANSAGGHGASYGSMGKSYGSGAGNGASRGSGASYGGMTGSDATGRKSQLPTVSNDSMIAVQPLAGDQVWAYSTERGTWKTYQAPKGTQAIPIMSPNLMALGMRGKEISQLAAFDPKAGQWYTQDLKEPGSGRVMPVVGSDLAVCTIGRYVYAFSAPAQRWGVLELEEGANPDPVLQRQVIVVEQEGHLHTFSAQTGRWTDFDTKSGK